MKHPTISRLLILLILSASYSFSFAQKNLAPRFDSIHPATIDSAETFKYTTLNLHTIGSGYVDAGKCMRAPLRWKGKDWLKVIAFAGTGLALHQLDAPINNLSYDNNTGFTKGFSKVGETIGNVVYVLPAIGVTYLCSRLTGNEELSGLTITAGKAVLIANTFVTYSKILAHRHRPNADTPSKPNQWDGPRLDLKDGSFMSSHTATSFALATVIASYYADKKWVPPLAYTMASLVAVSRIAGHDHWATDVFAGAVIGFTVGKLVYKLNRSKKIKLIVSL